MSMIGNEHLLKPKIEITYDEVALQLKLMKKIDEASFISDVNEGYLIGIDLLKPQFLIVSAELELISDGKIKCTRSIDQKEFVIDITDGIQYMRFPAIGYFACGTAGKDLADKVKEIHDNGRQLVASAIMSTGIIAIGKMKQEIAKIVHSEAIKRNFKVGYCMQPGSLRSWDVKEQYQIPSITNGDKIGMKCQPNGWIEPMISMSSMIPIGPNFEFDAVKTMCFQCPLTDCFFRQVDDIEDIVIEAK